MQFNPQAFDRVLSQVQDGQVFERFAQDLLSQVIGHSFVPVGGLHDKGIDGLEHAFSAEGVKRTIYQLTIDASPLTKARRTLEALRAHALECTRFFYVTNQQVSDQAIESEKLFDEFGVAVEFWDRQWLRGRVNQSEGTLRTYLTFVETYHHTFGSGSPPTIIADFDTDPRLFVFLRQQWESAVGHARLDTLLVDSLILYALEGTDPDSGMLRTRAEILERIQAVAQFAARLVEDQLDARLHVLATKPRRIRYHSVQDGYCLPYETRLLLEEKNAEDLALHQALSSGLEGRLRAHLGEAGVRVADVQAILFAVLNRLFKQQGLEFTDFVIKGENSGAVEKSLSEIIGDAVDTSSIIPKNRPTVKTALLATIRDLIYRGSSDELACLRRLANTYLMLFLLKCDPKVATYFSTLAGSLRVFVDNSILVPAISELPLEVTHRRHWSLLLAARRAGVTLLVTEATLAELASHIRKACDDYERLYAGRESIFTDESTVLYVDEIRLYSGIRGRAKRTGRQRGQLSERTPARQEAG